MWAFDLLRRGTGVVREFKSDEDRRDGFPYARGNSRLTSPKQEVEPRFPCLATIDGSDGGFTNAFPHRPPGAANLPLFPASCAIRSAQNHFTTLKLALDHQQLASVRHPTLMPPLS